MSPGDTATLVVVVVVAAVVGNRSVVEPDGPGLKIVICAAPCMGDVAVATDGGGEAFGLTDTTVE